MTLTLDGLIEKARPEIEARLGGLKFRVISHDGDERVLQDEAGDEYLARRSRPGESEIYPGLVVLVLVKL